MQSISRRRFLSSAAATSAVALSKSSYANILGANERMRFALIGCGGRGSIVTRNMITMGGELVGLCDLNPTEIDKVAEAVTEVQAKKPRRYSRLEQVLEEKDIDAVIVATPDHWHAAQSVLACQAGKDVYVEKPHAHNVRESEQLKQAAERYKRIVTVGTQNRSSAYNYQALDYIKSGQLGDIHLVKVYNLKPGNPFNLGDAGELPRDFDWNTWQGPAAERDWHQRIYNGGWHHYWTYSGGDLADDACHQIDLAAMLMGDPGFPLSVSSAGGRMAHKGDDSEVPDLLEIVYEFPDFIMTLEHSNYPKYMRKTTGTIRRTDDMPYWTHNATRIELYGSEMQMTIGRHGGGWIVTRIGGRPVEKVYGRPGDQPHCTDFIEAVKSRKPASANLDKLHPSISLLHLANIAHRVGNRKLWWDADKNEFKNAKRANKLLTREYRKGFEFPV
ncbi:MAG: Gfo/Idh/MocA family protein [Puniceicoccaceae bacterium]